MALFTLVGGPCNGNIVDATALHLSPGDPVDCGGVRYIWNGGPTAAATGLPTAGSGGVGGTLDTRQIGQAWHRLMHVFAVEAPHQLRRARAARARLGRLSR